MYFVHPSTDIQVDISTDTRHRSRGAQNTHDPTNLPLSNTGQMINNILKLNKVKVDLGFPIRRSHKLLSARRQIMEILDNPSLLVFLEQATSLRKFLRSLI